MKGLVWSEDSKLKYQYDDEVIWIEPFGKNSLRVRITKMPEMPQKDWAFITPEHTEAVINTSEELCSITNGNITGKINKFGVMWFENEKGEVLLKERWQTKMDRNDHMALLYFGRELKPILGGLYQATMTFEPNPNEKIFGMGQRQMENLDMMGCELELAQRNSQASIPFFLSNKGYGFFWNNPAYGRATFAKNLTRFTAEVTAVVDYWITAGDTPAQIIEQYTDVIGKASKFPEWAAGFWQCKLRYKNQEELLSVAREYKKRGLPISVIVIDFFHWPMQGDWKFDEKYWPDPKAMVDELKSMSIELMVSVWPTVDPRSENYAEMKQKGYLVRTDKGVRTQHTCLGATVYYDTTNPGAQEYVWNKVKENYFKYGIKVFWLDEAEPEYTVYDFELYRYYLGTNVEVGNIYPMMFSKGFYDGMRKEGIEAPLNLVRCAWAGSQRYGALLWSGDIHSSFPSLRMQFAAGLNVGLSGIPWWTTDIGGFYGGDPKDPKFRELIIRWFQYGLFCPVFRLHGYRLPMKHGAFGVDTGLFDYETNGPNEVWEFGEEAFDIISELMFIREKLRPYIMKQMDIASEKGTPPMRPVFYDFSEDKYTWEVQDEFLFGSDILVAPVLYEGQRQREVYLPAGANWVDFKTSKVYEGGRTILCDAPLNSIPVFIKEGAEIYL
jgi:alpha-D-xyloside xylohydrolase